MIIPLTINVGLTVVNTLTKLKNKIIHGEYRKRRDGEDDDTMINLKDKK